MPIVTMPNGDRVNFPDTMSREEIRAKILEKFPEADPDRGGGQKALETVRGVGRGLAQNVGTTAKLTGYLPREVEGFPVVGPAVHALRAFGKPVGEWGDQPLASNYEGAGRVVGRDVLPMFTPGGGGRLAAWGTEKAVRTIPTLAQLYALYAHPLETLIGHHLLQRAGVMSRLQSVFNAAAPLAGKVAGTVTRAGERTGVVEGARAAGEAAPDYETETPTPPPAAAPPDTPAVPGPGPTPGTARPVARSDAATDYPTPNRSGRGDRFPLYGSPTN